MSLPYFQLYVDDYEAHTAHLTLEEDGAYMRLLRLCWRTPGCSIPADPDWISRKMRIQASDFDRLVAPILAEFFAIKAGRYHSPRLTKEAQKASEQHEKRQRAGSKGGIANALKRNETDSSNAIAYQNQNQIQKYIKKRDTKVSPKESLFEEFWKLYPRKVGKGQAEKAWRAAAKKVDGQVILEGLQIHMEDLTGKAKEYCPHPATWLNGERWADELERDTFWEDFSWENSK